MVKDISALSPERQGLLFDIWTSLQRDPTGSQWTGAAIANAIMLNAAARTPIRQPPTTVQATAVQEVGKKAEIRRPRRARPARLLLGLRAGSLQPA
jgi:hypothetical protein